MVIPKYVTRMVATARFDRVLVRGYQHFTFSYIAVCVRAKLTVFLNLVNFCISIEYSPNTFGFVMSFDDAP